MTLMTRTEMTTVMMTHSMASSYSQDRTMTATIIVRYQSGLVQDLGRNEMMCPFGIHFLGIVKIPESVHTTHLVLSEGPRHPV